MNKITLAIISLFCCGCFASDVASLKENKPQKRSIGDVLYGSYGLPISSSLADTSISSHTHTHTHSTSIVDRPVAIPVSIPSITTTKFISPTIHSTFLPSTYSYRSSPLSSSYPFYGSSFGFGKYDSGFRRYYSGDYYPSIYSKSYYTSSPILKYKW